MGFQQNQLDRLNTTMNKEAANSIAADCNEYRQLLIMHIDHCINKLSQPMTDFDKINYGLERAFRDGELANLIKLKEIVE